MHGVIVTRFIESCCRSFQKYVAGTMFGEEHNQTESIQSGKIVSKIRSNAHHRNVNATGTLHTEPLWPNDIHVVTDQ